MRYQTRALTAGAALGPRENDRGYAMHLAIMARVAFQEQGGRYVVKRKGKVIYEADTVRPVVCFLRRLLEGEA